MSKSNPDPKSRILLTDTYEEITAKIKVAVTDSISTTVSYDPELRPGVSNLLELLSYFDAGSRAPGLLASQYSTLSLKGLKELVSEAIAMHLAPIKARYESIIKEDDGRYLDEVARNGGEKARASAESTMSLVRYAIGI